MWILWINLPYLLKGALVTVWMSAAVLGLGTTLGVAVAIIGAIGPKAVKAAIAVYVFTLRGVPVLIVMFIGYYGMPKLGYRLSPYTAVIIAMSVYLGAFVAEVVRGGIAAVPEGQFAAARCLGMTRWTTLREIVLPYAVRISLPPLLNTWLMTVKQTSYAAFVGIWELSYAGREVMERTFAIFEIGVGVLAIYFLICFPLSLAARKLEARYAFST